MTVWNRSYLEAIGLPVWVSRQAAVAEADSSVNETHADSKSATQSEAKPDIGIGFVTISGNSQSKTCLLVTAEQDLNLIEKNFKVLEQVWLQWQGTELPLALAKLVELRDAEADFKPVQSLKNKRLLLSTDQPAELANLTTEHVPSLNWQSADDKKGWWQLLQSFV